MSVFGVRREAWDIEPNVSYARSSTGEAFALAYEQGFGLHDDDHEVLVEALREANYCLTTLMWALHPELDNMENREMEVAIGDLVRRQRSHAIDVDPREHIVWLVSTALDVVDHLRGRVAAGSPSRVRMTRELDACLWHLVMAMRILDGEALERILLMRPVVREQVGAAQELMELEIAERRIAAQMRRRQTS